MRVTGVSEKTGDKEQFLKNNDTKLFNHDQNYKSVKPRSQMNTVNEHKKHKENHIIIKLLKSVERAKISKAARRNTWDMPETKIKIVSGFSPETVQGRRSWKSCWKGLWEGVQVEFCAHPKSFKSEGK